jgi:hypothetical protein
VGAGVLFALTLPGLVILLIVLAAVEHAWSRVGRPSPLHRRRRHAVSAGGLDVFSAALVPGRSVDLDEQRIREVKRDDVRDGAPPYGPIDLDGGIAYLDTGRESAT